MLPSVVCFKLGYKWKFFTEMKIFCIYVGSHAGNNPCLLQWVSNASDHMSRILLVIKGQKHCKSNSRHLFNFSVICLTQSKKARNKSTMSFLSDLWSLNPTAGLIDPHLPFNQCCLTLWFQVWVTHSPVSSCVRFVRLPDGLGMVLLKLLSEKAEKMLTWQYLYVHSWQCPCGNKNRSLSLKQTDTSTWEGKSMRCTD